jgi:hypothetical protein
VSQRLFSVPKVGLFLDSYKPAIEKRRGEEVKVIQMTLRLQPFDGKLARAIDDGVGEDSNVKVTLFKMGDGEAKPHLDRVDFALGCQRQQMTIFASPDTEEARLCFDQVKISGTYARTEKGVNDYAFVFKATFGPVGRNELEYIHDWHLGQRFVTFEEAEPGMFDVEADDDEDVTDADEKAREVQEPMWTDGDEKTSAKKAKRTTRSAPKANRPLHSHQSKKKTGRSARA